ncbi:hypothetical protein WA158_003535 [Blastocystis sp. Blastoise]
MVDKDHFGSGLEINGQLKKMKVITHERNPLSLLLLRKVHVIQRMSTSVNKLVLSSSTFNPSKSSRWHVYKTRYQLENLGKIQILAKNSNSHLGLCSTKNQISFSFAPRCFGNHFHKGKPYEKRTTGFVQNHWPHHGTNLNNEIDENDKILNDEFSFSSCSVMDINSSKIDTSLNNDINIPLYNDQVKFGIERNQVNDFDTHPVEKSSFERQDDSSNQLESMNDGIIDNNDGLMEEKSESKTFIKKNPLIMDENKDSFKNMNIDMNKDSNNENIMNLEEKTKNDKECM